jgi:hypothetical protein
MVCSVRVFLLGASLPAELNTMIKSGKRVVGRGAGEGLYGWIGKNEPDDVGERRWGEVG